MPSNPPSRVAGVSERCRFAQPPGALRRVRALLGLDKGSYTGALAGGLPPRENSRGTRLPRFSPHPPFRRENRTFPDTFMACLLRVSEKVRFCPKTSNFRATKSDADRTFSDVFLLPGANSFRARFAVQQIGCPWPAMLGETLFTNRVKSRENTFATVASSQTRFPDLGVGRYASSPLRLLGRPLRPAHQVRVAPRVRESGRRVYQHQSRVRRIRRRWRRPGPPRSRSAGAVRGRRWKGGRRSRPRMKPGPKRRASLKGLLR